MDVSEAREKYPWAKELIQADRNIPSSMAKSRQSTTGTWRGVYDRFRRRRGKVIEGESPCADILHVYIRDKSVNTSGEPIIMEGMSGIGEEYRVESYYTEQETPYPAKDKPGYYISTVETGAIGPDGEKKVRPVSLEECMYYPNRRLIIYCSQGIIFDGGAPNLHGRLPLSQFRLDDVAGELLGFPVMMDAKPAVDSANAILRTIEDSIHIKANPDLAVDKNVPKDVVDNLKKPKTWVRKVYQYSISTLAKAIIPLIPPEYLKVESDSYLLVEKLFEWADYQAGTKDIANFAKLRQLPAGDTVQNLLQAMGDLPVDQSRNIEAGLMPLGPVFLGLALQVYTTERLMQILGAEEVAEFMDFRPTDLVPLESSMDNRPRWLRAREFMKEFPFYASPNSLHERQSMTQQLKRLQARNAGVPMSNEDTFNAMFPEEDWSENFRKYKAEQREQLKLMVELQVYKQELENDIKLGGNLASLLPFLQEIDKQSENGNKEGRPPTNAAPAESKVKTTEDGVPRTTLATSGEG